MHFNKLTPAEAERIAILMEEASEVIKACCKILRHGYHSLNPDAPEKGDNQTELAMELGDLAAAMQAMENAEDIDSTTYNRAYIKRLHSFNKYTHHQS